MSKVRRYLGSIRFYVGPNYNVGGHGPGPIPPGGNSSLPLAIATDPKLYALLNNQNIKTNTSYGLIFNLGV